MIYLDNFFNFNHSQTFPVVAQGPTQNLDPFGSAVYWIKTDRQAEYKDKKTEI